MVHNGIEYALMQLIGETYTILKVGLQMDNNAIQNVFSIWGKGRLQSFLLEITSNIFLFKDAGSNHLLLDRIKDVYFKYVTGADFQSEHYSSLPLWTPATQISSPLSNHSNRCEKSLSCPPAHKYVHQNNHVGLAQDLMVMFYFGKNRNKSMKQQKME